MKKSYIKPQIAFESLELAESIASCAIPRGSDEFNQKGIDVVWALYNCGYYIKEEGRDFGTLFMTNLTSACDRDETMCYTIPNGSGLNVFLS